MCSSMMSIKHCYLIAVEFNLGDVAEQSFYIRQANNYNVIIMLIINET